MQKVLMLCLFTLAFNVHAFGKYDDNVTYSVEGLGFSTSQILQAIKHSFETRKWQVEAETENSVTGNLNGSGQSKIRAEITNDMVKIRYITKHEMENYKFYKRLLGVKATMMVFLTDCKNKQLIDKNSSVAPEILTRRNLVYAFYKYNWRIDELSKTRIVASLPAKGRIEVDYTPNGISQIRRWDEIQSDYTNPSRDGYVRRVKNVFERQQVFCTK